MEVLLILRKAILRYALLPRLSSQRARNLSDELNEHERYHLKAYDNSPLYFRASIWERWSLQASALYLLGKPVPRDTERIYHSKGYKVIDIGPERMIGKGTLSITKARLEARLKEPVHFPCELPLEHRVLQRRQPSSH